MSFGKKLRYERRKIEMSQDKLSEMSGVSKASIINIESGKTDPQLSTVISLCKALKLLDKPLEYFYQD